MLVQNIALFIALFIMAIGMIFTIIPPLPGTVIIWAAAAGYGYVQGWEHLGWLTFILLTLLMIVGVIADTLGGQFGARIGGASCLAIVVGSIIGFSLGVIVSLFGTPIAGCLAGIAGTLGGILLIERARHGHWQGAVKASTGFMAGTGLGIIAKVITGGLMIAAFLIRVFYY
jgi:uncharacterized protein YqgC (DUF456 family)